jgi:aspartyl-tRNA(Asn)/glutamyl-tRNA(Gln) amidotransferase subunit A
MEKVVKFHMNQTVQDVVRDFVQGHSREAMLRSQLERIQDSAGEGGRTFLKVYDWEAPGLAAGFDQAAKQGRSMPPYAGVTVSIKDLFDVAGDVTTSGSVLLKGASPAKRDAVAVARLKSAGFIPVGRTNMTEFAFSGLGINPHYGTPLNPYDRDSRRIPGGSSSGAAVSISDGMATVALGTDTGGSCRIPAALCGLVGFKPTASRVPMDGTMPLSPSLDSIGSIGHSVACCAVVDAVISAQSFSLAACDVASLKIGIPSNYVFDDVDRETAIAFDRALARLSKAGVTIVPVETPELLDIPSINAKGGLVAREAYLFHRDWIEPREADYDPRVLVRIRRGATQTDGDYRDVQQARCALIKRMAERTRGLDAIAMPTVPLVAPTLDELAGEDEYSRVNLLMLRNCTVANMLDRCAISLPCHEPGQVPVGFTLMGENLGDQHLLETAATVERVLR